MTLPALVHLTACTATPRRLGPAEAKLRPVMNELAYNLESFNPAFTAVLLKVGGRDKLGGSAGTRVQGKPSPCRGWHSR